MVQAAKKQSASRGGAWVLEPKAWSFSGSTRIGQVQIHHIVMYKHMCAFLDICYIQSVCICMYKGITDKAMHTGRAEPKTLKPIGA